MIEDLRRLHVIAESYSSQEKKAVRSTLVDYESAPECGIAAHGSQQDMTAHVFRSKAKQDDEYERRRHAALHTGARVRRPYNPDPLNACSANPYRFVAIVRVPRLDRLQQEVERGFHCLGCRNLSWTPLHHRRQFTTVMFDQHLKQYGLVQNEKHIGRKTDDTVDYDDLERTLPLLLTYPTPPASLK
jgi:hypothetical protein